MKSSFSQSHLDTLKLLSDRIVEAQKPIRILDAIKWPDSVKQQFMLDRTLPVIDADFYKKHAPLSFDPKEKRREFHAIERDITRNLGEMNPISRIMRRMCREYQHVIRMLEARGTEDFSALSQELYGSASDVFHAGDPTVADLGRMLEETLTNLSAHPSMMDEAKNLDANTAVSYLNEKLQAVFPDAGIRVMMSDGITADAAAGTDYIKINENSMFNQQDLDILEVHEGWVHLGTTLNGMNQPYCTYLHKGPPSATVTQEGLAVLTEIMTLRASPVRLTKLMNRVRAVTLAEEGANFHEVFDYLVQHGLNNDDAWTIAARVFRGSAPNLGPFTKDITYLKGFILIFNFMRLAINRGKLDSLPMLFCGKINLEDIRTYAELAEMGVIAPPKFLPPYLKDFRGMATFMSFSRFINKLSFDKLELDYGALLK